MIYPVYSVRDVHAGFSGLQVEMNPATAARNFRHAASQGGSIYGFSPADFALYHVADFDTETGEIKPCLPEILIQATDCEV